MKKQKLVGWFFIAFPLLVQIPFTILANKFHYPDVLRDRPGDILQKFQVGGPNLIWTWYLYAMSIFIFLAAVIGYKSSSKREVLGKSMLFFGVASAFLQLVALLRWTFVVPFLARLHADANSEARESIEVLFTIQHNFLGVGMGEHLGQLTMVIWTVLMIIDLKRESRYLMWIGISAATFLSLGLTEHLSVVFGFNAGVLAEAALLGFMLWTVWLIAIGTKLVRAA